MDSLVYLDMLQRPACDSIIIFNAPQEERLRCSNLDSERGPPWVHGINEWRINDQLRSRNALL